MNDLWFILSVLVYIIVSIIINIHRLSKRNLFRYVYSVDLVQNIM